jgi:hypothetical protein
MRTSSQDRRKNSPRGRNVPDRNRCRQTVVLAPMSRDRVYDEPSEVTAEQGEVIVEGPDAVAVSLTPDAALETSERLLMGGLAARGQQIAEARRRKPHSPSSGSDAG